MGAGSDLPLYLVSAVVAGRGSGCNWGAGGEKMNQLPFFCEEEFLIKGEIATRTCKVTSLSHSVCVD